MEIQSSLCLAELGGEGDTVTVQKNKLCAKGVEKLQTFPQQG